MKLPLLQRHMKENNLDLIFLLHPDPNITYFTQEEFSYAFLTIKPRSTNLHITKLDTKPSIKNITTKTINKQWQEKLKSPKIKTIGINKEHLTVSFLEKLKKIYPKAKFKDISQELINLRMQKTEQETKLLSKACQITTNTFNNIVDNIQKFKTEQSIARYIQQEFENNNATTAFPSIVATSKNSAIPHHHTSNQKLKRGFLQLDFGAKYKNYCADMSRVLFLGTPTKKEKYHYNLLLEAQQSTISQTKSNQPYADLDKFVRKQLKEFSSYFYHSLGHGIGVEVHEKPSFNPSFKHSIKKDHLFTIEPGTYFPGKFGLRIEDTIHFGKKPQILTKAPKELITLK